MFLLKKIFCLQPSNFKSHWMIVDYLVLLDLKAISSIFSFPLNWVKFFSTILRIAKIAIYQLKRDVYESEKNGLSNNEKRRRKCKIVVVSSLTLNFKSAMKVFHTFKYLAFQSSNDKWLQRQLFDAQSLALFNVHTHTIFHWQRKHDSCLNATH